MAGGFASLRRVPGCTGVVLCGLALLAAEVGAQSKNANGEATGMYRSVEQRQKEMFRLSQNCSGMSVASEYVGGLKDPLLYVAKVEPTLRVSHAEPLNALMVFGLDQPEAMVGPEAGLRFLQALCGQEESLLGKNDANAADIATEAAKVRGFTRFWVVMDAAPSARHAVEGTAAYCPKPPQHDSNHDGAREEEAQSVKSLLQVLVDQMGPDVLVEVRSDGVNQLGAAAPAPMLTAKDIETRERVTKVLEHVGSDLDLAMADGHLFGCSTDPLTYNFVGNLGGAPAEPGSLTSYSYSHGVHVPLLWRIYDPQAPPVLAESGRGCFGAKAVSSGVSTKTVEESPEHSSHSAGTISFHASSRNEVSSSASASLSTSTNQRVAQRVVPSRGFGTATVAVAGAPKHVSHAKPSKDFGAATVAVAGVPKLVSHATSKTAAETAPKTERAANEDLDQASNLLSGALGESDSSPTVKPASTTANQDLDQASNLLAGALGEDDLPKLSLLSRKESRTSYHPFAHLPRPKATSLASHRDPKKVALEAKHADEQAAEAAANAQAAAAAQLVAMEEAEAEAEGSVKKAKPKNQESHPITAADSESRSCFARANPTTEVELEGTLRLTTRALLSLCERVRGVWSGRERKQDDADRTGQRPMPVTRLEAHATWKNTEKLPLRRQDGRTAVPADALRDKKQETSSLGAHSEEAAEEAGKAAYRLQQAADEQEADRRKAELQRRLTGEADRIAEEERARERGLKDMQLKVQQLEAENLVLKSKDRNQAIQLVKERHLRQAAEEKADGFEKRIQSATRQAEAARRREEIEHQEELQWRAEAVRVDAELSRMEKEMSKKV